MRKTLALLLLFLAVLLGSEILRGTIDILLLRRLPTSSASSHFPIARGAIHVHSRYSDGSGTIDEIMQAAQACSLDFVILTDHNNIGARLDHLEKFYGRTLLLIGEEISTTAGHVLSIGAACSHTAPVIDDIPLLIKNIHADSGLSFIAHADHPRMRWKSAGLAGARGIEIINADSEWRNDPPLEVLDALVAELVGLPGMHYLIDLPTDNLRRWDEELRSRRLIGIGAVDAHARIKLGGDKFWAFPSYQEMFALLNTFVVLKKPLSRDVSTARRQIIEALAEGRSFFAFNSLGYADGFEFNGEGNDGVKLPQDTLFVDAQTVSSLRVKVPATKKFVVQLYRNGLATEASHAAASRFQLNAPGVYRVIVYQERLQWPWFSTRRVPWIFSNPIFAVPRNGPNLKYDTSVWQQTDLSQKSWKRFSFIEREK